MVFLSYWDEIDLSLTNYDDNWKSQKLADEPTYTEDMQAIDRWCQRRLEFYRNRAINAITKERNEREYRRRNRIRKALRLQVEDTYGEDMPDDLQELKEYIYSEAPKPPSINQGFNEDWMDEDLIKRDLYHPCMDLMKQWLRLSAIRSSKKLCDKMREQILSEEVLSVIINTNEDAEMDFDILLDKYDDEL